jgi:chemotaxis family two-component system response regulator Rcp1
MNILVVEDNKADARLAIEAVKERNGYHHVQVVEDGLEAMVLLRREGHHAKTPRPDLILLDLNLPHKDGREVLAEMKADPALRRIPTIILTSTQAEVEVQRLYDLGATAYCLKPNTLDEYLDLIQMIVAFWSNRYVRRAAG